MHGGPPNALEILEKTTDDLCDLILSGHLYPIICDLWGVSPQSLLRWIAKDPDRSARVKEAKSWASEYFDSEAGEMVMAATDAFELAKAKEMAHHSRWRAQMFARGTYSNYHQKSQNTDTTAEQPFVVVVPPKASSEEEWGLSTQTPTE